MRRRYEAFVAVSLFVLGTPDGKVEMSAATPRLPDGKPDFSGIWTTAEPNRRTEVLSSPQQKPGPRTQSANDTPGDPAAITASRQMANIGVDIPGGLPYQPWLVPIVKERTANLAKDDPHIKGYSSGKWSGDTLVIDTMGLRDDTWIDWNGSVLTEAAKVQEQMPRPDFGHLEIQVTVDDPKAYTKPCAVENEQSLKHMK